MKNFWILCAISCLSVLSAQEKYVFPHSEVKPFAMYGNVYRPLASKAMGCHNFEIWKSSIAAGSKTPRHSHESEEIFVLLKGEILAVIGDQEVKCTAPATLVCPARIPHQLFNVGKEDTEQIVVLGLDSKIYDVAGKEMQLPWR
ncbi:MAG TPA: cupin domain-containing protein [Rhabdochlamydiaceae bacterium]|jgi:mannose-6-phosphate isomerase-like protein (cupin superfamily)